MDKTSVKNKFITEIMPLKENKDKPRVLYIDVLKIIAAFCVVFYHFAYYKLDYGSIVLGGGYIPNYNRIIMSFLACSVPIFFMVNGSLIFSKERRLKTMLFKAVKLFILYFLWELAKCPTWFLATLGVLYLLFPLFQWLRNKHKKIYMFVLICSFIMPFVYNTVILFLVLFLKSTDISFFGVRLSHTGLWTMYSILYFLLGAELFNREFPIYLGIILFIFGWAFLIFECWTYTNVNGIIWDGVNASFPSLGALALSVGIIILVKKISFTKIKGFLTFVSKEILSIYLLHALIIMAIGHLFPNINYSIHTAFLASILIFFICVFIGKLLSKIPVVCWFTRV